MRPIDKQVPADTRRCLQYWPATNAVPIQVGKQTPYEGAVSSELALTNDLERLALVDMDFVAPMVHRMVYDTFMSEEIQSIRLRAHPTPAMSNTRAVQTALGSQIELLSRHHPSNRVQENESPEGQTSGHDGYAMLFSYIAKSRKASIPQGNQEIKAEPASNGVAALKPPVDKVEPHLSTAQAKRTLTDAQGPETNAKRTRSATEDAPVKSEARIAVETKVPTVLNESSANKDAADTKGPPIEHSHAIETSGDASSLPPHIEALDDYLAKVFQEDDVLSDNSEAVLSYFRRIPQMHGDSIVLSKRSIRRIRELLVPCTAEQLAKSASDGAIGRLIRLLTQALETADSMGLADMIKGGASVENGVELSPEFCQKLDTAMSITCLGLEASALATDMIASGRASSSAYSEDSLHTAVAFFKECLLNCAIPIIGLERDNKLASAILGESSPLRSRFHAFLGLILVAHSPITALVEKPVLAEQDIISIVFSSISTMFSTCELLGHGVDGNLFESVRRSAQALLRRIFAFHVDQRSWILEEILASLIKLPAQKRSQSAYRIASGKSVQYISILLLMLLQGTAQSPEDLTAGFEGGMLPAKECRILLEKHKRAVDAASSSTDFTIRYLIGRCIKRENKPTFNEADYRNLLDTFIEDCITLLGHPQWPVSELVVRIYSLHMLDLLGEEKADFTMKSIALESAAQVASHIARAQRALEPAPGEGGPVALEAISPGSSLESITRFSSATAMLLEYLQSKAAGGGESAGAIPLYIGNWASMLISTLLKGKQRRRRSNKAAAVNGGGHGTQHEGGDSEGDSDDSDDSDGGVDGDGVVGSDTDDDDGHDADDDGDSDYEEDSSAARRKNGGSAVLNGSKPIFGSDKRKAIEKCLKAYMEITHRSTRAMPNSVTYASAAEAAKAAFALLPLYRSFDMLLSRVTLSLGASLVTLRSKALRALNQIASHSPSVLYQANVKYAINHRLQDSSPQVREAAIDLIGKHVAQNPELTGQYYEFISVRVLDKGPGVRKRVMRILKSIYIQSSDQEQLVDIGVRLLQRTSDEERSIRELATKTLQELWFTMSSEDGAAEDRPVVESTVNVFNALSPDAQRQMMKRVRVMTGVMEAVRSRELSELMATLFGYVTTEAPRSEVHSALFVIRCVIDALFEQLLRSEEAGSTNAAVFSTAACLRFISALSGIAPEAVGSHAETLSAYLKMTDAAEEDMLQNVLVIFSNTLLKIPHPSAQFLGSLEGDLIALLSSSPQSILTVAIPCLCLLVGNITRNYSTLVRLFRSCVLQLYREQRQIESGATGVKSPKNVMRFMILAGLMCRYFEFDDHRERHKDVFRDLEQLLAKSTVPGYMNSMLLFFASPRLPSPVQLAAMQMLGQLYIKRPQLALTTDARAVMDRVFAGSNTSHKLQVVRNFLEFLREDAKRYDMRSKEGKGRAKEVDAKALVGSTGDMGEAGVGASLMQTYLDCIIDATFVPEAPLLRSAGFEVVSLVLEQGLAHPLKCVPALIALGTDGDPHIRSKSLKLHQDLNLKYASFIHSRDMEGVRKAYEYQASLRGTGWSVAGYSDSADARDAASDRPVAYLQPLYTMLRSKRPRRNEFLTSLVNSGDYDASSGNAAGSGDQPPPISLVRFIAENISALDFKFMEEVLHVAYQISAVIASTGLNIFHMFEAQAEVAAKGEEGGAMSLQWRRATEASVCIAILFVLREFLKSHYGISEARCLSFNPGDSAGVRDKPVAWHSLSDQGRIDWSGCPYAVHKMETLEAYSAQRMKFRRMIAGSLAAVDDNSNALMNSGNRSFDNNSFGDMSNASFGSGDISIGLTEGDVEFLANQSVLD
ncbi:hypothetical protein GQ54DRAFT_336897 [Martensiomyces pterosporus]|nr:hypothetical protein GQ54DRAFT_336897 [Martensiomyces pterosporus]